MLGKLSTWRTFTTIYAIPPNQNVRSSNPDWYVNIVEIGEEIGNKFTFYPVSDIWYVVKSLEAIPWWKFFYVKVLKRITTT